MARRGLHGRFRRLPALGALGAFGAAAALAGCMGPSAPDYWGGLGAPTEDAHIIRLDDRGPILLVFSDQPFAADTPPDGLRRAALDVAARAPALSAAAFHRGAAERGERWLYAEISRRRHRGEPARVVVAGLRAAGPAAAEAVGRLMRGHDGATVDLLVTVDAVRPGAVARAAGMTAAALRSASPVPTPLKDPIAYESAPRPDGALFRRHVNYYQAETAFVRGASMPGATVNHRVTGPPKTVGHANVDAHVYPLARGDFERALWGGAYTAPR